MGRTHWKYSSMGSKIVIESILKGDKRRYNRRKTFITGSRMEETLLQVFPFGVVRERRYLSAAAKPPESRVRGLSATFLADHRIAQSVQ
jgi:hypothetical protein